MPARIARHPIHPMLVVFPIGLWIFSLIADLIFLYSGGPIWRDMAFYTMIGGLIGALAAAIPGFIDYFSLTGRAAKRTGTMHMTLNLIVVALYAVNIWLRAGYAEVLGWPLALSVIAVVLLGVSGWLGGDLVYVQGVGVEQAGTAARRLESYLPDVAEEERSRPRRRRPPVYDKASELPKSEKEGRL